MISKLSDETGLSSKQIYKWHWDKTMRIKRREANGFKLHKQDLTPTLNMSSTFSQA